MTKRQRVRFEMLRRVRDFGSLHVAQFAEGSVAGQAFATVRTIVDDLGGQAQRKMATRQEGSRARKQARLALTRQLNEVVRTAKVIARTMPRFDDGFRLPADRSDLVMVTAGRLFAETAEPVAAQFIAHGMSDAFLTTLRASVQEFEASITACEDGSRSSAAAQARIAASLDEGMDAVTRLDIIIANQFKDDVATLAQWTRDRQVRAVQSRPDAAARAAEPDSPDMSSLPMPTSKASGGQAVRP